MTPESLAHNEVGGIGSLDGFAGQGPEVGVPDGDFDVEWLSPRDCNSLEFQQFFFIDDFLLRGTWNSFEGQPVDSLVLWGNCVGVEMVMISS